MADAIAEEIQKALAAAKDMPGEDCASFAANLANTYESALLNIAQLVGYKTEHPCDQEPPTEEAPKEALVEASKPESEPTEDYLVFVIPWTEFERGWGQRPDGYSIHLTREDAKRFIDVYWASRPDEVPDEYSKPNYGENEAKPAYVSKETFEELRQNQNGNDPLLKYGSWCRNGSEKFKYV